MAEILIERTGLPLLRSAMLSAAFLIAMADSILPVFAAETEFAGRWDLTLLETAGYSSAWLEIRQSAQGDTRGELVWIFGGAEPLEDIAMTDNVLTFSYLFMGARLHFTASLSGDTLSGTATDHRSTVQWTGARAPELPRPTSWRAEDPIALFTGYNLAGWTLRNGAWPHCWHAEAGILFNDQSCADLRSLAEFMNFHLHLEFQLRDEGGSGVYLRGRYEVQIAHDTDRTPGPRSTGAIFGHIAPTMSAGTHQGEWQRLDLTLLGRDVTVRVNGQVVIANQPIPGPTGAALDSQEARPGPIMLQGDHGLVSFRNIVITPLLN